MDLSGVQGLLSHLSSDEYKEILNDEDKFESLFKDVKEMKDWEAEKEMLIASNRSLAEFNLAKEPQLAEAKRIVTEKSAIGEEICNSIREKLDVFKSKSGDVSTDTTLALLQTAAAESEEESEKIAQSFLDGEIDLDKFLEDFSKIRIVMHIRKVKVDKMKELMDNKERKNLFASNVPYPTAYSAYPGYPASFPAMPMPGIYGNHF